MSGTLLSERTPVPFWWAVFFFFFQKGFFFFFPRKYLNPPNARKQFFFPPSPNFQLFQNFWKKNKKIYKGLTSFSEFCFACLAFRVIDCLLCIITPKWTAASLPFSLKIVGPSFFGEHALTQTLVNFPFRTFASQLWTGTDWVHHSKWTIGKRSSTRPQATQYLGVSNSFFFFFFLLLAFLW